MSSSRQLAAIMFTDIVGYTALMGKDEQKAFELLRKNRAIQRPIIAKFNGRWLKEIGDGVLASFTTVSDAIYCAATIQKTCETEPDLKLRIGIHQAEVVFEGNDVFGDGVNIASRLESEAPVGGILVSNSVYKNLTNKGNIQSTYVGEKQLKNVPDPIRVYQVLVQNVEPLTIIEEPSAGVSNNKPKPSIFKKAIYGAIGLILILLVAYFVYSDSTIGNQQDSSTAATMDKSVVVLPFTILSDDPDQGYFGDGMMEEIIDHLVRIRDLKVVSSTTSMNYKATTKSAREIAQELGVATVLEGSIRKDGNQVRITVQLIEGATDTHLFSQSYDRQLNSIFEVQSEVAQKIAGSLKAQILPEVKLTIEEIPTKNTLAYEAYLKGREKIGLSWFEGDISHVDEAITYFKKAIELDPEFSDAYAGLGHCFWNLAHFSPDYDPVFWDSSKQFLHKAIALDPHNGNAFAHLGVIQHNWDWDIQSANQSLQTAVELSPSDPAVHNHLYYFYLRIGDCDQAEAEATIANDLWNNDYDPLSDFKLLVCRRDLEAIENLKMEDPRLWMFKGEYQRVIDLINNMDSLPDPLLYVLLGEALALNGDSLGAIKVIEKMELVAETEYLPSIAFAPVYMALGNKKKAYEMLEQALDEREYRLHFMENLSISLYKAQDDPRYQSIVKRSWIPRE